MRTASFVLAGWLAAARFRACRAGEQRARRPRRSGAARQGRPRRRARTAARGRMPSSAYRASRSTRAASRPSTTSIPDAPKGGTLSVRNPDRRTSFDKFNPFTIKGSAPAGLTILMFETLAVRSRRRAAARCTACSPRRCWSRPTSRRSRSACIPKARFYNGDPVTAADVKHSLRHADEQAGARRRADRARRRSRASTVRRRPHRSASTSRTARPTRIFNAGALPVFSRKWGAGPDGKPKPFDEIVNEYPITSGPYTIERRRLAAAASSSSATRTTGRTTSACAAGSSTSTASSTATTRTTPSRWRRSRPASSTSIKEYSARALGAPAPGRRSGDDGRIVKQVVRERLRAGAAVVPAQPAAADASRTSACARRSATPTTSRRSTVYSQFKRANSVFNNSEFAAEGHAVARASWRCSSRSATSCRRKCSARRAWRRAPTRDPNALRDNLLKARELLERGRLEARRRRQAAQRQGRAVRVRVPRHAATRPVARTPMWSATSTSSASRCKRAHGRLRAVPQAPRDVRLRHRDDRRAATSRCRAPPSSRTSYGSKSADETGTSNFRGVKSRRSTAARRRWSEATTLRRAARRGARARPRRDVELLAGARPVRRQRAACRTGTSSASRRCSRSTSRSTTPLGLSSAVADAAWWDKVAAARRPRKASSAGRCSPTSSSACC